MTSGNDRRYKTEGIQAYKRRTTQPGNKAKRNIMGVSEGKAMTLVFVGVSEINNRCIKGTLLIIYICGVSL